jgi:transportin-3
MFVYIIFNYYLQHLVDFLPTLHTFLSTTGSRLVQDDRRQVYEAIAYVISAMPMERAAESLRTFSLDILTIVHTVANASGVATKQELTEVGGKLSIVDRFVYSAEPLSFRSARKP